MSRWPELTLQQAGVTLIDCDHRTPAQAADGHPYVAIPQIADGRIDLEAARRISASDFGEWTRKAKPRAHDVVLSRRCNPGETAHVAPGMEFALGQNLVLLRANGEYVLPEFLRWLVRSPAWFEQVGRFLNVGAVFDSLKCRDIPNFRLPVPSKEVQARIASMLSSLDDKIDLNRRMSQTLESVSQAIFKSWFIDFDVSASERMAPEAQMRDSTLGAEVARCGGFIQTGPFGSQLHASDYVTDGVPVVMPQDMQGRRVSGERIARVPASKAGALARHRLLDGDVVYSRRGDVERHALISVREEGWLCGTGCLLVRPGPGWPSQAYLSDWLDLPIVREWLKQHAVGATMPNLNTGILASLPIRVPGDAALTAFERCVRPLRQGQLRLALQSEVLTTTRDTLLPRLLSGQLPVPALTSEEAAMIS